MALTSSQRRAAEAGRAAMRDPVLRAKAIAGGRAAARKLRGIPLPLSIRKKISISQTIRFQDPKERAKLSERLRGKKRSSASRKRYSMAKRKMWKDPKMRAKMIAAFRKIAQDPEVKARRSKISKELWQDPKFRARMVRILRAVWKARPLSTVGRAKLVAAQKKRWKDPDYRARMAALSKARWDNPEYRKRIGALISKALKRRWAISPRKAGGMTVEHWKDPIFREMMQAKGRENWRRSDYRAKIEKQLHKNANVNARRNINGQLLMKLLGIPVKQRTSKRRYAWGKRLEEDAALRTKFVSLVLQQGGLS
jgi:hypothetical protein